MSLAARLAEHVRACFAGIWIQSWEHEDALVEIADLCRQESWRLAVWSIDRGFSAVAGQADNQPVTAGADPLAAVRAVGALAGQD
ncbi:MAG TPA: AAA family ATPase, partial [Pirellulales bacterium]|nr:AAA family ATPase [Pirellulales bacterium]